MQYVNMLIKPASSLCNLRCRYCFYEDESEKRMQKSMGVMQEATAQRVIEAAVEAGRNGRGISFSFQGGEPTVAGLPFFERFVSLVREENKTRLPVSYAIQTNGTLLDEEWADFFARNHFLVGISVDGGKGLHDQNRMDAQGKGTYAQVTAAYRMLKKHRVDTNILCVVTRQCAGSAQRVYRELKAIGAQYLQFIPCLDPLGEARGCMKYSLTPEAYGNFLCALFDIWYQDWCDGRYISIRYFDDLVHMAMGMAPSTCSSSGRCGGYVVVESDASVYPCDFYALDAWRMGSLMDTPLEKLMQSETYRRFCTESMNRPKDCANCAYERLCHGGCRRDWTADGNYFCAAYKRFFAYVHERIHRIAYMERMAIR